MSGAYPAAVARAWHPVAALSELRGRRPLARVLMGRPLAVFQGREGTAVLVDRCPHRNVPLSAGKLRGGEVECAYHGWRFGTDGRCSLTPGAETPAATKAQVLPVTVREGLVWTCLAQTPPPFPELPAPVGRLGYDTFWWAAAPSQARLIDAMENLLDPAHPHFLHPGMVRSGARRRSVTVTVRTRGDRAEAVYVEDARPSALMPRLLEGMRVASVGRAFAPCTAQVAFEGPSGPTLAITVFLTPEDHDRTRPFAHFATPRGRAPAAVKEALLRLFHWPVLAQDRAALSLQARNIRRFGGPHYALGPLDFLLPSIQALMDGASLEEAERTAEVRL